MSPGRSHRTQAGLTLIEVMAATAVLLAGAAAATGLFVLASDLSAGDDAVARAREVCREREESLLALPFLAGDAAAHDLISEVFPHARPYLNTASERFLVADEAAARAGSFVTERTEDGADVHTIATFVRLQGMVPQDLRVEQVIGWSGEPEEPAPSDALLVEVVVTTDGARTGSTLLASADRDLRRALQGRP